MKVTRRSDSGTSGHLLISVPASRVAEVEAKFVPSWFPLPRFSLPFAVRLPIDIKSSGSK